MNYSEYNSFLGRCESHYRRLSAFTAATSCTHLTLTSVRVCVCVECVSVNTFSSRCEAQNAFSRANAAWMSTLPSSSTPHRHHHHQRQQQQHPSRGKSEADDTPLEKFRGREGTPPGAAEQGRLSGSPTFSSNWAWKRLGAVNGSLRRRHTCSSGQGCCQATATTTTTTEWESLNGYGLRLRLRLATWPSLRKCLKIITGRSLPAIDKSWAIKTDPKKTHLIFRFSHFFNRNSYLKKREIIHK